jgi:hypothetical protein
MIERRPSQRSTPGWGKIPKHAAVLSPTGGRVMGIDTSAIWAGPSSAAAAAARRPGGEVRPLRAVECGMRR